MSAETRIKGWVRALGLDVRRLHNVPDHTLLGLRGRSFGTVLDIGANRGQFAAEALEAFPVSVLHCFEPLGGPCAELSEWAARSGQGRVFVHHTAVGDTNGSIEIFEHVDHSASSSLLPRTELAAEVFPQTRRQAVSQVPITTLDEWTHAQSQPLAGPVFLKIDVQGYEAQVLRGAVATLPLIDTCVLEVSMVSLYDGQARFAELVTLLDSAGLEYSGNLNQFHAQDGSVLYVDAAFRRRTAR